MTYGAGRQGIDQGVCFADGVGAPASNGSADVTINNAGALRMGDSGVHPVCMSLPASDWVLSQGSATVTINGQPASRAQHLIAHRFGVGNLQPGSTDVTIGGATVSMEDMARGDALEQLEKGIAVLNRWNAQDRKDFIVWFGSDDPTVRIRMLSRAIRARDVLKEATLHLSGKRGASGRAIFAYVQSNDSTHRINLEELFWSAKRTGADSRMGTVLHELSHFDDVGATDDHRYGRNPCRMMAILEPSKAQSNADSFEYWLEDLK